MRWAVVGSYYKVLHNYLYYFGVPSFCYGRDVQIQTLELPKRFTRFMVVQVQSEVGFGV